MYTSSGARERICEMTGSSRERVSASGARMYEAMQCFRYLGEWAGGGDVVVVG